MFQDLAILKNVLDIRYGRIHRWDFFIFGSLSNFFASGLDFIPQGIGFSLALLLMYIPAILIVRRLRDIGLSGWWAVPVLFFIPISLALLHQKLAGPEVIILFIVLPFMCLLFVPPQKKHNKYGPYIESMFTQKKALPKTWKEFLIFLEERAEKFRPS